MHPTYTSAATKELARAALIGALLALGADDGAPQSATKVPTTAATTAKELDTDRDRSLRKVIRAANQLPLPTFLR